MVSYTGCIKPYEYESVSYEENIVVDGLFTDKKEYQQVRLTYTYPIDVQSIIPIKGANVQVIDGKGNSFELMEIQSGVYRTTDSIAGIPGEEYQLQFSLSNGKRYESKPSKLIKSPPIDSIYDHYAELPSDVKNRNEGGIQFFVDVHDDTNLARYFRYEWEETYVIHVPYPSNVIYYPETKSWEPRTEGVGTCYKTNYSNQLILGNSIGSKVNRLSEFPIRFVSGENETLRSRYSILVRQYVVDDPAYNYYRKLRESVESGGTLFDKQQGAVLGNIVSLDDPGEVVLGYFDVAGVSEKRAFFAYLELDEKLNRPRFNFSCTNSLIETTRDSVPYYYEFEGKLIVTDDFPFPIQMAPKNCSDCSWYATTIKPDFW